LKLIDCQFVLLWDETWLRSRSLGSESQPSKWQFYNVIQAKKPCSSCFCLTSSSWPFCTSNTLDATIITTMSKRHHINIPAELLMQCHNAQLYQSQYHRGNTAFMLSSDTLGEPHPRLVLNILAQSDSQYAS
jgi:hypothetical protein